jgi:hypothetical protein
MRGLVVCLLLVGVLGTLGTVVTGAQAQPSISVSPQQGPSGTVPTIGGEGFAPGDTVYLEVFPGIGPNHGTVRLATVTVDADGEFRIGVVMPPEGFENWGRVGGEYTVMAYPHSFGARTTESVEVAPKAVFTLTPGIWPPSGVGPSIAQGESARGWPLAALGLAAAFGSGAAAVFVTARRKA